MTDVPVVRYLGVDYSDLDGEAAARLIAARPADAPFAYVVTPNAQHVVRLRQGDVGFVEPYRDAWLRLSDSQVARGLARSLQGLNLPLASGSDLTATLFRRHIAPDDAVTVIGGGEEVTRRLRATFGLTRLTWHDPPMGFIRDSAEVERCIAFILDHPARYVFFAVGAPQSERLAQAVFRRGGATGTGLCIGSSLLFLTGMVPRAPLWMRRAGLEWLFRLGRDPRRHARRVFVDSLPLVGMALKDRFTGGKDAGL